MISDLFSEKHRGLALGIFSSGSSIGAGLALIVGGYAIGAINEAGAQTLPLIGTLDKAKNPNSKATYVGVDEDLTEPADEIDRYLEAGLSLEKTLRAATSTARRHFGFEQSQLEVGAPFDAVLLDASPFSDISALRKPRQVWRQVCVA